MLWMMKVRKGDVKDLLVQSIGGGILCPRCDVKGIEVLVDCDLPVLGFGDGPK